MNKISVFDLHGDVWAIEPSRFRQYAAGFDSPDLTAAEVYARTGPKTTTRRGMIAVLPLTGPLGKRPSAFTAMFGGTSTDKFGETFDSHMARPDIRAIVIDVDSPGGAVEGTMELADKIYRARGKKPIIAVANGFMASAAYWIASAADTLVVIPSGQVGSIGVRAMHLDFSVADKQSGIKPTVIYAGEHKTEFSPHAPLSKPAEAEMQRVVNSYYSDFANTVARNRGKTVTEVKRNFGGGRMMLPNDAARVGAVDAVGTMDWVVTAIGTNPRNVGARLQAMARNAELAALEESMRPSPEVAQARREAAARERELARLERECRTY